MLGINVNFKKVPAQDKKEPAPAEKKEQPVSSAGSYFMGGFFALCTVLFGGAAAQEYTQINKTENEPFSPKTETVSEAPKSKTTIPPLTYVFGGLAALSALGSLSSFRDYRKERAEEENSVHENAPDSLTPLNLISTFSTA